MEGNCDRWEPPATPRSAHTLQAAPPKQLPHHAWSLQYPGADDGVAVLDALRIILDAEAEARRQFDAARDQAGELVRQAEDEAQQQVLAAHDARETDAAAVEAHIVAEAERQSKRILATAEATAAAMHAQAAARMERAVAALVNAVLAPETQESDGGR